MKVPPEVVTNCNRLFLTCQRIEMLCNEWRVKDAVEAYFLLFKIEKKKTGSSLAGRPYV